MFKFRKQPAQAKKNSSASSVDFEFRWKPVYNWIFPLLILLCSAVYVSQLDNILPIKKIQLSGSFEHIAQQEIEAVLKPYIGEDFLALDIHALQKKLGAQSWAESVSIRRVWPDRLDITIVERRPVARWDENHLVSDQAIVFAAPTNSFGQLPLIHTRRERLSQLLSRYHALDRRFEGLGEKVVALREDSRGALDIELSDGLIIKVGRDQLEHKIARLMTVYEQQIRPRRADIRQLDLRYSNGFAVAWKKEQPEATDQASIGSNDNV